MGELRLDDDTVDRILAGLVDPVDAPPGFEAAVTLLAAARGAAVSPVARLARPARPAGRLRPRLPILAAALVLGGASGAAYAAGLPAAASSTAHDVVRSLERSSGPRTHPLSEGSPDRALTAPAGTRTTATREPRAHRRHGAPAARRRQVHRTQHGHGAAISALAHSASGTAGAKGATISAAASGGKSHAGEHGHNGKGHASDGRGHGRGHGAGRPR
jgi:hypothetical protein